MNEIDKSIEFSVVSAMFFEPSLIEETILKPLDFGVPAIGKIFQLMQKFSKDGLPIDEDFILKKIPNDKIEEYQNILIQILATNPISNPRAYEIEIKENAKKRALEKLITGSKKLLGEKSSKEVLKTISKEIELLEDEYKTNSIFKIKSIHDIKATKPSFLIPDICPIQENEINILSANGGSGKSFFCGFLSLNIIKTGKKCFSWFSEDDEGITKSRLHDIINIHKNLEITDNLTICGRETMPFHFVEKTSKRIEINDMFYQMKKELRSYDVIILDPLIAFFGGDENNNAEARYFMSLLNSWCATDKKTIIMIHHNNKVDKDGNSTSRGASAFTDACRMQYNLKYKFLDTEKKEIDKTKRIAELVKTNHWYGIKEFEIKLFNTPIFYEENNTSSNNKKVKKDKRYSSFFDGQS